MKVLSKNKLHVYIMIVQDGKGIALKEISNVFINMGYTILL